MTLKAHSVGAGWQKDGQDGVRWPAQFSLLPLWIQVPFLGLLHAAFLWVLHIEGKAEGKLM